MAHSEALFRPANPTVSVLTDPLNLAENYCRAGAAVIFGVCGLDGDPVAGVGLACRIVEGDHVRLLLLRPPNADALLGLTRDGRIAVTITRIGDHESIQLKGGGAFIVAADPEDLSAVSRQLRAFRDALIDHAFGEAFATATCHWDHAEVVAVQFLPSAAFTQTPGPGAGALLTGL